MLNNFKLSTKLTGAFIILSLITGLLIGTVSIVNFQKINKQSEEVYTKNLVPLEPLNMAATEFLKIRLNIKDMALSKASDRSQYLTEVNKLYKNVVIQLEEYGKGVSSGEEVQNYNQLKDAVARYDAIKNKTIGLIQENQIDAAVTWMTTDANAITKEIDGYIKKAFDIEVTQAKQNNDSNVSSANMAILLMMLTVLISIVFAFILGALLSKSIAKPLLMGVENLSESAQQVASAAEQLSTSSQMLAESNSEQASSIEETSSTLEESSSMIQQNTENTKQALQLSAQSKASSDRGNLQMKEMIQSMNEIKKSSDQIAKIIKVIDDIAFQTNILALNAAVEVARAGDAGMGFAVVAEEVRNLAQRSAQAAKDTASMIETNIQLSEKGVDISRKVAEVLEEVALQARKVNELMDEITAASQEQSQGIGQITRAMAQMEQATQQNAATAEQSAAASEQLSAQAQTVSEIVQQLRTLIQGASYRQEISIQNKRTAANKQFLKPQHTAVSGVHASMLQRGPSKSPRGKMQIIDPNDVIPFDTEKEDF